MTACAYGCTAIEYKCSKRVMWCKKPKGLMNSCCQSQNCDKRRHWLEQTCALVDWQAGDRINTFIECASNVFYTKLCHFGSGKHLLRKYYGLTQHCNISNISKHKNCLYVKLKQ